MTNNKYNIDQTIVLGSKDANLADMSSIGLPIPPGFTITTDVCSAFHRGNKNIVKDIWPKVLSSLDAVGKESEKKFGDLERPLLVSVRSGPHASMHKMAKTVLNLGMNDDTVKALAAALGARFAFVRHTHTHITQSCAMVIVIRLSSGFISTICVFVRSGGVRHRRKQVRKTARNSGHNGKSTCRMR